MRRFLKYLLGLLVIAGVLIGTSYVGARARAATFLGSPLPELGPREVTFAFGGLQEFAGAPRAWIFNYGPGRLPNTPYFQIYIALTGRLVGTEPRDLQTRLRQFQELRP